jgi:flagellar motor switch protein FliM
VLDELPMSLSEVMNLEVGQTLLLNVGPEARIELRCGGVGLLAGRMGRIGHQVAVRVENQFLDRRTSKGT